VFSIPLEFRYIKVTGKHILQNVEPGEYISIEALSIVGNENDGWKDAFMKLE
jgi:hypothetical protein